MSEIPDGLTLKRDRDLAGRFWHIWARRAGVLLVAAVSALALANVFGQQPRTHVLTGGGATLDVSAPTRLRGGLLWEARFRIRAARELEHATLVLDSGWTEGMSINTVEPAPIGESSRDGRLALDFGRVAAGDELVAYFQFQVNPTNVGRRSQDVGLYEGETPLVKAERTVTVFP